MLGFFHSKCYFFEDFNMNGFFFFSSTVLFSLSQSYLCRHTVLGDHNAQDTFTLIIFLFYVAANNFHITAYFMKRWVNLRCALGKRYRGKESVSNSVT